MIEITSSPIGEGRYRTVYLHPLDGNKAIKISKGDCMDEESKREIKYYKQLTKRKNINWKHLSQFYGEVETNKGHAIEVELVRDYDGNIAKIFDYYIKQNGLAAYQKEWEEFKSYFVNENICVTKDLKPDNILLKRINPHQSVLVLVDGIGDTVAIDILNYSKYLLKRKILRRFARAEKKLQDRYAEKQL